MHDFRRLRVWQLSRELVVAVTAVCQAFPRSDRGLVAAQLRRAALSIPANIAEGCGKSSRREILRYFQIASGSALEVQSHLHIASDLGYLSPVRRDELSAAAISIERMLARLMQNLP